MSLSILPPPPGHCQECAVEHEPDQPHNRDSLFYAFIFNAQHNRSPTWVDAMAHCPQAVQVEWLKSLAHYNLSASVLGEIPEALKPLLEVIDE